MEYFKVACPGKGKVFLDGVFKAENFTGIELRSFVCTSGLHDISMVCDKGNACQKAHQRLMIRNTSQDSPQLIQFECGTLTV